jgi:aminoglycoside phosphotransferase (APT) family kinase protein
VVVTPVSEPLELTTEATAGDVLRRLGVAPADAPVEAHALSGGISNVVLAASWPGGRAVLKQSLPALRVAVDWQFDRARIITERRAMSYLGRILPAGSVPTVLAHDDDAFLFIMSHAPEGAVNWKEALLRGEIDLRAAERAGALLGEIHRRSADDLEVARDFANLTPLLQGRVDPYHHTAAAANPGVAGVIEAEVERLLATRRCLVLGDWSPKNLLVYPDRVLALDFEVAHVGDPAFDVAFLLTHLVLKRVRRPVDAAPLRAAADAFLRGYGSAAGPICPPDEHVVAELGCLLLARVDGKSRIEYLPADEPRVHVRALAYDVLRTRDRPLVPTLDRLLSP